MKLFRSLATAGLITALFAPTAFAHGFAHRRGAASALMPCMVVATTQQKADLRRMFLSQKQTLITDRQNLRSAKQALNEAILSGSKDVTSQEAAVGKAQQQLLHDRDALAAQFCGQLSQQQLGAAQTLYNNLSQLRAESHRQARSYFAAARGASTATTSQSSD
jgi:hypothetical protein